MLITVRVEPYFHLNAGDTTSHVNFSGLESQGVAFNNNERVVERSIKNY